MGFLTPFELEGLKAQVTTTAQYGLLAIVYGAAKAHCNLDLVGVLNLCSVQIKRVVDGATGVKISLRMRLSAKVVRHGQVGTVSLRETA